MVQSPRPGAGKENPKLLLGKYPVVDRAYKQSGKVKGGGMGKVWMFTLLGSLVGHVATALALAAAAISMIFLIGLCIFPLALLCAPAVPGIAIGFLAEQGAKSGGVRNAGKVATAALVSALLIQVPLSIGFLVYGLIASPTGILAYFLMYYGGLSILVSPLVAYFVARSQAGKLVFCESCESLVEERVALLTHKGDADKVVSAIISGDYSRLKAIQQVDKKETLPGKVAYYECGCKKLGLLEVHRADELVYSAALSTEELDQVLAGIRGATNTPPPPA